VCGGGGGGGGGGRRKGGCGGGGETLEDRNSPVVRVHPKKIHLRLSRSAKKAIGQPASRGDRDGC